MAEHVTFLIQQAGHHQWSVHADRSKRELGRVKKFCRQYKIIGSMQVFNRLTDAASYLATK